MSKTNFQCNINEIHYCLCDFQSKQFIKYQIPLFPLTPESLGYWGQRHIKSNLNVHWKTTLQVSTIAKILVSVCSYKKGGWGIMWWDANWTAQSISTSSRYTRANSESQFVFMRKPPHLMSSLKNPCPYFFYWESHFILFFSNLLYCRLT